MPSSRSTRRQTETQVAPEARGLSKKLKTARGKGDCHSLKIRDALIDYFSKETPQESLFGTARGKSPSRCRGYFPREKYRDGSW